MTSVTASRPGEYGRPNRTYLAGRICAVCDVPLSIYNPERTCSLHGKPRYSKRETGNPTCRVCGEKVPRTEYVSIRKRCKTCDRKPPWEEVA